MSNLGNSKFANFIPLENLVDFLEFLRRERLYQSNLINFLSGSYLDSAKVFSSSAYLPPFTKILNFESYLTGDLQIKDHVLENLNRFLKSRPITTSFTKTECCGSELTDDFIEVLDKGNSYLLMGSGLACPSIDYLRVLKHGFFYIPERGRFSIHDSLFPIVLGDLTEDEFVYPIIDEVSGAGIKVPDFYNLSLISEGVNLEIFKKSEMNFCKNCGMPLRRDGASLIRSYNLLLKDLQDILFFDILDLLKEDAASVKRIEDNERLRFLKLSFDLYFSEGPIALVGVLRTFSRPYLVKLNQLIEMLSSDGSEIYIADTDLSSIEYDFSEVCKDSVVKADLVISLKSIGDQQVRVRLDTTVGSYTGIIAVLKNFYLMNPVAKIKGLSLEDLNVKSDSFSYFDEIEMQGISFRNMLSLSMGEVFRIFKFVREISKLHALYGSLPLSHLRLDKKIRDLDKIEYALLVFVKEGIPILKKGGSVCLENILTALGRDELAQFKAFLKPFCGKGRGHLFVYDTSVLVRMKFDNMIKGR